MSKFSLIDEHDKNDPDVAHCILAWEEFERAPTPQNAAEALMTEAKFLNGYFPGDEGENFAIEILARAFAPKD